MRRWTSSQSAKGVETMSSGECSPRLRLRRTRARVPAEMADGEVEDHLDHGDLAEVEIGGDDLSVEARPPLERDLLHELAGEVLDELELLLLGGLLVAFRRLRMRKIIWVRMLPPVVQRRRAAAGDDRFPRLRSLRQAAFG